MSVTSTTLGSFPKYYKMPDGTSREIPSQVFDIVRQNGASAFDEYDDVPYDVEYNGHYGDNYRTATANFDEGTHSRIVPIGQLKHINSRREVPCGFETKTSSPPYTQIERECRTVRDYDGSTHKECRDVEKQYPGKQSVRPLECEENKTTFLEGFDVNQRKYSDSYGNQLNQKVITPELAVAKIVGPPHLVGSHPPLKSSSKSKSSKSKSKKSKSRSGGVDKVYVIEDEFPSYSSYRSDDRYGNWNSDYNYNTFRYSPRAPSPSNEYGASDYSYRFNRNYVDNSAKTSIAMPFPFSARSQTVKFTPLRGYLNWLMNVNDNLKTKFTNAYTHTSKVATDTIGTLESYILAGVSRGYGDAKSSIADALDAESDRGLSVFAGANQYFRYMNPALRAYLQPMVRRIPGARRPIMFVDGAPYIYGDYAAGPFARQPFGQQPEIGPSIMSTYPINPIYRPASATGSQVEQERAHAVTGLIELRNIINLAAIGQFTALAPLVPGQQSPLPYVRVGVINSEDQVLGVLDAEVLALLARLQYEQKVITNWASIWADNKEGDVQFLVDYPSSRHLSQELRTYLSRFSDANKTLNMFIPIASRSSFARTTINYYPGSSFSSLNSLSSWSNFGQPSFASQTIMNPPIVRKELTSFRLGGNEQK